MVHLLVESKDILLEHKTEGCLSKVGRERQEVQAFEERLNALILWYHRVLTFHISRYKYGVLGQEGQLYEVTQKVVRVLKVCRNRTSFPF